VMATYILKFHVC